MRERGMPTHDVSAGGSNSALAEWDPVHQRRRHGCTVCGPPSSGAAAQPQHMRFSAAATTTHTSSTPSATATAGLHARSHVEAARMAVERRLRAAWQREDDAELLTSAAAAANPPPPPPPPPLRSALRSVSEASSSTAQPSQAPQQQQPELLSVRYLKEAVEQLTSFVFDELEATASHLRTMQLSVHDTQRQLDGLLAQTAAEKRRQAKVQAAAALPPPPPASRPTVAATAAAAAAAAAAASNDDSAAAAAASSSSSAVRGVVAALIEDAGAAAQRLSRAEASWAEQRAATHGTLEELSREQRRAAAEAERLLARVGALEDGREEHAQALLTLRLRQWRPDGEDEEEEEEDAGGATHRRATSADVADAAAAAAEAAVEAARVGDLLERHAAAAEQRHSVVCGRLGSAEERAGRLEVDMACAKQAVNGLERQAGGLQVAGAEAAAKVEAALAKVAELRSGTRRAFHSISECLNIPSPSVL